MFRFFFFFSSRRRHTRLVSDWSSDVCSSDLTSEESCETMQAEHYRITEELTSEEVRALKRIQCMLETAYLGKYKWSRSEERRVGKSVDLGGRRIMKKKTKRIRRRRRNSKKKD